MALEYVRHHGKTQPKLVACPACGYEFPDARGRERVNHIASHDPADFGLEEVP